MFLKMLCYEKRKAAAKLAVLIIVLSALCACQKEAEARPDESIANETTATQAAVTDEAVVTEASIAATGEAIHFTIPDGGSITLTIPKSRIGDGDLYGVAHIDNRWELSEIDAILNAIKGTWRIDKYAGFVYWRLYSPGLFDLNDNLDDDIKAGLYKAYEEKVIHAQTNIPNRSFSVKEYNGWLGYEATNSNYIVTNGSKHQASPISIILSTDRLDDFYPIFADRNAIATEFDAEYPVLYIKFFFIDHDENYKEQYEPATLVISSDNRFYILMDGAFYTLKKIDQGKGYEIYD